MWNANALILSITVIVLVIANVWVFPNLSERPAAADPASSSKQAPRVNTASVLQGRLLKIDGEFYVVKDTNGKEVRVHVGKDTALDGRIKVGDKIDVQVSADGHATTVLKALE